MGSSFTNGSGDYAIAFSTVGSVRRTPEKRKSVFAIPTLGNETISPLSQAVIEATEETMINSLFMAKTMTGQDDTTIEALPLERVLPMLLSHDATQAVSEE